MRIIASNTGKIFEQDFANSVDKNKFWLYRLRDNAASFSGGDNTRFASSNICDYLLFHDESKSLYLLEMKSTVASSMAYSMIRDNQFTELMKASVHTLIPGFLFNFRNKDNATYYMHIATFNEMKQKSNKKSFNIKDLNQYGALKIDSKKKRTRYCYDVESFVEKTNWRI